MKFISNRNCKRASDTQLRTRHILRKNPFSCAFYCVCEVVMLFLLRLCQEKCASYFSNLHTLFYKLQSAVLLLLEGLLFTQNFMGCLISISATVNLHGGCFDGYILKRNAYSSRNFKRFRNRILHMFSNKHINSTTKQATA